MIDPHNITNYDRNITELQEFLVFAVAVAGKNSDHVAPKINALFKVPLFVELINNYPWLENGLWEAHMHALLKQHKTGNYGRMMRFLKELAKSEINLVECQIDELLSLYGVGPKSACFFLLHSRPKQDLIVLDTHVRKFLASKGWKLSAIPDKIRYLNIVNKAIQFIKSSYPQLTLAEADLQIWKEFSGRA